MSEDQFLSTHQVPRAADTRMWIADADGNQTLITLAALADILALSSGTLSGQRTTVGGSSSEVITVEGATPGQLVFCQLVDGGDSNSSLIKANVTDVDEVTVTFNDDPTDDVVFNYFITNAI
jgi:hypothetical protein